MGRGEDLESGHAYFRERIVFVEARFDPRRILKGQISLTNATAGVG